MPTAKKLPSGSWRCRVFSGYEARPDGTKRAVYESFTVKDPSRRGKKECERMAAEWALSRGRREVMEMTVGEAVRKYIDSKEKVLSPATASGYEQILRAAMDEIRLTPVGDLTSPAVQSWVNALASRTSPKYVRNANALLGASLRFLGGPSFNVTLPQPVPFVPHVPDDVEVGKLIGYITETTGTTRHDMRPRVELKAAVMLSAFGSLRRGEICALTADDFDMDAHTVRVSKDVVKTRNGFWVTKPVPKTDTSNRVADIPAFVCALVASMDSYQAGGAIFHATPDQISNRFRRAVRFSGAEFPFRFHDLRHYYVSIAHALGVPDAYIMEMGGWKTESTMKRVYRATLADRKAAERDRLTGHFDALHGGA